MVIDDTGVIIIGHPGCGKSETTLGLLDRGHYFVADDLIALDSCENHLWGYQTAHKPGWLYIHSIGFIHCDQLTPYKKRCLNKHQIDLVVELKQEHNQQTIISPWFDMLINNHPIKKATIDHCQQRNSSLLIEALVKGFNTNKKAYNASNIY